jgi:hypothetical protein
MKRFLEGFLEGVQYMLHNREGSLPTLARVLGSNDRQLLLHAYDDIVSNTQPNLIPSQDAVKNLFKMVAYADKRATTVKPEQILDFSILEELGAATFRPAGK